MSKTSSIFLLCLVLLFQLTFLASSNESSTSTSTQTSTKCTNSDRGDTNCTVQSPINTVTDYDYNNDDDEYYDTEDDLSLRQTYNSSDLNQATPFNPSHWTLDHVVEDSISLLRLKHSLLYMYDRTSRPLENSSKPMQVRLGLSVAQINNLDEVYQVMTSTLQVTIRWRDDFLRWNESLYPMPIAFRSNQIWTPDILAINNVNNFKFESKETYLIGHANNIFDFNERSKYFIMVNPNGDCHWMFPMKLMSICELDQQNFPFDRQTCFLDFKSSAYKAEHMKLNKHENGVKLKLINEGEFDLIEAKADEMIIENNQDGEQEPVLRVTLVMKRKITFYFNKIILPYFVFYIVTIFTYVLPIDAGEKKSYSTSILISVMIYLKDVSNFIPKTHFLPMISIYFNLNLILVFICIMASTFVYMVYFCDKRKRHLPKLFRGLVSQSKRALHDHLLCETLTSFDSHLLDGHLSAVSESRNEIKRKLADINRQLGELGRKIGIDSLPSLFTGKREDEAYLKQLLDSRTNVNATCQHQLDLGVLGFLVEFKHLIAQHQASLSKSSNQLVDVSQEIKKNREKLARIHYINTLENIKNRLMACKKKKKNKCLKTNSGLSLNEAKTSTCSNYDNVSELKFNKLIEKRNETRRVQSYLSVLSSYKRQLRIYLTHVCGVNTDETVYTRIEIEKNSVCVGGGNDGGLISNSIKQLFLLQPHNYEWKYLALLLDRALFLFFSILIPICIVIMYAKTRLF